jgi:glutathione S-transferase
MTLIPAILWSVTVTVLAVAFYFYSAFRVGNLRGKHNIKAPACSGHPEFDRAFRVQMNTLEQLGIFLPLLWIATFYPIVWAFVPPLVGLVWVTGRIVYMQTYMADPEKRLAGAGICGLCDLILLILAVAGVAKAWFIVYAI